MQTDTEKARDEAQWEAEQRRAFIIRAVRLGVGVFLLVFSFPVIWFSPFLGLLFWVIPFLMLLGAILIAPDIAGYVAGFFGSIIWPHHEHKLTPIYGIPESLAARGKYAEAEEEYEKIIQEFPSEVKPHIDMINIAVMRLNDGELAEKLYQRGTGQFKIDS